MVIEFYDKYYDVKEKVYKAVTNPYQKPAFVTYIEKKEIKYAWQIALEYRLLCEVIEATSPLIVEKAMGQDILLFNFNCFSALIPEKPIVFEPKHWLADFVIAHDESAKENLNKLYVDKIIITKSFDEALEIIMSER
jgi:hypothetical protein